MSIEREPLRDRFLRYRVGKVLDGMPRHLQYATGEDSIVVETKEVSALSTHVTRVQKSNLGVTRFELFADTPADTTTPTFVICNFSFTDIVRDGEYDHAQSYAVSNPESTMSRSNVIAGIQQIALATSRIRPTTFVQQATL